MGNSASQGSFFIQLEKSIFVAGQFIRGTAFLNLQKPFSGNQVILKIKGLEYCQWTQTKVENQGKHQKISRVTIKGKKIFYANRFQLFATTVGGMNPGQYAYPFQIRLREDIPSSFYEKQDDIVGQIKYKVKVELPNIKGRTKIKYTQQIHIRELAKKLLEQNVFAQVSRGISVCCCINKGKTSIKSFFHRNGYFPGQKAEIFSQIDNSECEIKINSIQVSLMKVVNLISDGGKHKAYEGIVNKMSFQGLNQGSAYLRQQAKKYDIPIVSMQGKNIQPTATGTLVRCKYYLKVQAKMSGCTCCQDEPQVRNEIMIFGADPGMMPSVSAPPGWAPTLYQPRQFICAPNTAYGPQMNYQPI